LILVLGDHHDDGRQSRGSDGTEVEVRPGDAFVAAPGHDPWVIGEEACVALDFVVSR
jgi:hypothetical protein